MSGFDYIRTMRSFYRPRTPRAALIAAQEGLLPVEAILFKGSSVKPLFEEPFDPEELERVLAQGDLDLHDAMILAEIFAAMTREGNKERALFAAESLTALENRWARKVEACRKTLRPGDGEAAYRLARALYEQALIAGRTVPIRNYYLREAYYVLADSAGGAEGSSFFNLRIRCLLKLGLIDQAEMEIAKELEGRPTGRHGREAAAEGSEDPEASARGELLALAVEAAYLRKDVRAIHRLLGRGMPAGVRLDPELTALLESWAG
jgi:hypothetical protein